VSRCRAAVQPIAGKVSVMFPNVGVDTTACDATGSIFAVNFTERFGEYVSQSFLHMQLRLALALTRSCALLLQRAGADRQARLHDVPRLHRVHRRGVRRGR
jgi:hypothetical protein